MSSAPDPAPAPTSRRSEQIIGLDLLRFIAAALVMMFHLAYWPWFSAVSEHGRIDSGIISFPTLGPWFSCGWVGVEIFFVISGFVICYTASTPRSFLRSRLLRLFPAIWICATLSLLCALATDLYPVGQATILYFKSLILFPHGPWIDGVYWSLRVEICFYALVFVLLAGDRFRYIEAVMMVIGSASSLFCIVVLIYTGGNQKPLFSSWAEMSLLTYGCLFALGTTFWLSMTHGGWSVKRLTMCAIYTAGGLAITTTRDGAVLATLLFLLSLAFIASSIRWNSTMSGRLGSAGKPLIRAIGLSTYPIYLLHNVVGTALMRWFASAGLPDSVALFAAILAVLGMAAWVALWAEPFVRQPLRRAFVEAAA